MRRVVYGLPIIVVKLLLRQLRAADQPRGPITIDGWPQGAMI